MSIILSPYMWSLTSMGREERRSNSATMPVEVPTAHVRPLSSNLRADSSASACRASSSLCWSDDCKVSMRLLLLRAQCYQLCANLQGRCRQRLNACCAWEPTLSTPQHICICLLEDIRSEP